MRKFIILLGLVAVAGIVFGQSFTDVATDDATYGGKQGWDPARAIFDANFALLEGGVTLSATATAADTWGINASHPSATGLYATVELLDSSVAQNDTDYVKIELFEGVNDSAESTVWARVDVVVDDNTTNTEDSAIEVYQPIAGVQTKVLDISAGTVTIPGDLTITGSITASGTNYTGDLAITGDLAVGTNLVVGGTSSLTGAVTMVASATVGTTLGVTGVATFTDTPVCSDGLTVSTNATVGGTLGVTGVLTLTAAPVFTAITTAGTATALTTNAPAITEETPVWVTVSYGGSDYVMPIWLKD